MKVPVLLCALLLLLPATRVCLAQSCPSPATAYAQSRDAIPLCLVAAKVQQTLDRYSAMAETPGGPAPRLAKAEFDFKTTRSNTGGFSLNLLVFKFGATHESDTTEEVTFSYAKSPPTRGFAPPGQDFSAQLLNLLTDSAAQVRATQQFAGLPFNTLTLNLGFGVTWDVSAGGTAPAVALITAGGSFDHKNAAVQSIKLTFGP